MIEDQTDMTNVLLPGERVLWQGRPVPRRAIFTSADAFLIPFSLMWGGSAVFWESSVLASRAPGFFALWGIPFVIVGLYVIFGRFLVAYRIARTARYAVTDRRIVIVSGLLRPSVTSLDLRNLPFVQVKASADGIGDIAFAASPYGMLGSSSWMFWGGGSTVPTFRAIPGVVAVQATIERARAEASQR